MNLAQCNNPYLFDKICLLPVRIANPENQRCQTISRKFTDLILANPLWFTVWAVNFMHGEGTFSSKTQQFNKEVKSRHLLLLPLPLNCISNTRDTNFQFSSQFCMGYPQFPCCPETKLTAFVRVSLFLLQPTHLFFLHTQVIPCFWDDNI
jgi:hypothetical protein